MVQMRIRGAFFILLKREYAGCFCFCYFFIFFAISVKSIDFLNASAHFFEAYRAKVTS